MPLFDFGDPAYDVDDAKIFTNDGEGNFGDLIDVPGISILALNFRTRMAEARGDGKIVAVASKLEAIEVTIKGVSIPLDMIEVFLGTERRDSGSPTTTISDMTIGGRFFPRFGVVGRVFAGESQQGKMILIPYLKIMDSFEWRFEENQFAAPELKALALEDPTLLDENGDPFFVQVRNYRVMPAVDVPLPPPA